MPITVEQHWNGYGIRIGDSQSIDSEYIIRGTADEGAAWSALNAFAQNLLQGFAVTLVKGEVSITERLAEEAWAGEVQWQQLDRKEPGESTFQFDTGGGTQHITRSLQRIAYAPPGQTAPAVGGIGDTGQSVEGVDIQVPVFNFSETHYLADQLVTPQYKLALFRLTGSVNDRAFKGFAAGEVLFQGASGSKRGQELWEITFRFAAGPNAVGLSVGDITGIAKRGHDYLWVRYSEESDAASSRMRQRPIAVYVERVYPSQNFGALLI